MMRQPGVTFSARLEGGSFDEDEDTSRLVTEFQAGDRAAFAALYQRYFDRVYGYLRVLFNNRHEAEETAQQAFTQILEALPRYERRAQPFRAWLFVVVRNTALRRLAELNRMAPMEASELDRHREVQGNGEEELLAALSWISDPDLTLFIERLPLVQRQVLLMRFMFEMSHAQVASVLGRSEDDVRALQYRALSFLRKRLHAVESRRARLRTAGGTRAPMQRAPDKANVLRARRFAIWR